MIGILLVSHESLGESLIACATHVLRERPPQVEALSVFGTDAPEVVTERAHAMIARLDTGEGVLVLSDICGATPCNVSRNIIAPGRVECVAGVNLPMLLRALTYRNRPMTDLIEKALSGGRDGVMRIAPEECCNGPA